MQQVASLFKIISWMDYFIPQANVNAPLDNKLRLAINDGGQDKYPSGLFQLGVMEDFPAMGKSLQRAPKPAVDAYKKGELLAWLVQYGIGNSFLKRAVQTDSYPFYQLIEETNGKEPGMVLDFRELESYEYKKDYEPYGGVAFFTVNKASKTLQVEWLVAPRGTTKILHKEKNGTYRRAESMIMSTLYFSVIAGKHLAEIHMTYNLLEVAAHNSFDVKLNEHGDGGSDSFNAHPVRLYLYIHLFSQSLAEELTTEHLVQKGAVFSQVFAMKYDSLCTYLSQKYNDFVYASDEDFEYRKAVMEPLRKLGPPTTVTAHSPHFLCSLDWELEYYEIFSEYAKSVVEATYGTGDAADSLIQADEALQGFFQSLECTFNQLPARYEGFQTANGLTCFLADSSQHLVVRHQFYGTTAIAPAMDPRLGSTQVPVDGGTPAVDEWRSLAFIALATAYANFVHILDGPEELPDSLDNGLVDIFEDATPVVEGTNSEALVSGIQKAWERLQQDLEQLNTRWTAAERRHWHIERNTVDPSNWKDDVNYMYCRPLPKDLHTGPGY